MEWRHRQCDFHIFLAFLIIFSPRSYSGSCVPKSFCRLDGATEEETLEVPEPRGRTTVCLRNVPNNYTRQMLLELLEEHKLSGHFDFLYLPCDFHRHANLGYAFVNLVDEESVTLFWKAFDGFTEWALPTAKVGRVSFSGPHQGLLAHIERYRNSPVMHKCLDMKAKGNTTWTSRNTYRSIICVYINEYIYICYISMYFLL